MEKWEPSYASDENVKCYHLENTLAVLQTTKNRAFIAIPYLDICPKEMKTNVHTNIMFTALFIGVKSGNNLNIHHITKR